MAERGELDLTGAKQNTGVWLVKVPKYLSQQWAKAPGRGEVGKLRIAKNQGRTEVSFTLNEDLANIHDIGGKPASVSAPREHPFVLQSVGGQTLTVFTESSSARSPTCSCPPQRSEASAATGWASVGWGEEAAEVGLLTSSSITHPKAVLYLLTHSLVVSAASFFFKLLMLVLCFFCLL